MILTTTQSIEGRAITEYLGIVCGEAFENKEFKGERYYLSILTNARNLALKQLEERASGLGADAVVGIDLDYEVLGQDNGMLMVTASGTAVKLG